MALDVGADEGAARHDPDGARGCVVEHTGCQAVAEPTARECRIDLGVHEDAAAAAIAVVGDSGQLAIDDELVSSAIRVVTNVDGRLGCGLVFAHDQKTSGTLRAMPPRPEFDPYRVLGVGRTASEEEVAAAYRALAKQVHPDLHGTDAARRMQEANRAFRILGDRAVRRAWDGAHPPPATGPHWAPVPAGSAPPPASGGPATWAGWEQADAGGSAGPGRVRVEGAWPRAATPQPAPAGGVRDSVWLAVGVALTVIVGAVALGWIASTQPVVATAGEALSRAGISPTVRLSVDPEHEVAVFKQVDGGLGLVAAERGPEGWDTRILTSVPATQPVSVQLYVDADALDQPLPSIAFGRAGGGVAAVRVAGSVGAAAVANGTWAAVAPGISDATKLQWEFELVDGSVLRGTGETGG